MKRLLFVSDIMGTIDGANDNDYENLAKLLQQLKVKHGVDEVLFSLCTADSSTEYLKHFYDKVVPIFSKHGIILGRQYCATGYLENGEFYKEVGSNEYGSMDKIKTTISYVKILQADSDIVAVYYTDDSMYNNYVNGYVELELDYKVYYHFISIENFQNISSYNYSSSMKENIHGVIQGLNFHLGMEEIKEANREYWIERKKRLEEERIAKGNEEKEEEKRRELQINAERERERLKQEAFKSKQFFDFRGKPTGEEYNSWIQTIKEKYFGNIKVHTIFDGNYRETLNTASEEWSYKPDAKSYSLSEIMTILGYIDILDVLLLYCKNVREEETDTYYCESGVALCGMSKIASDRIEAPLSENPTDLYVKGDHRINIVEFLMRKEKISLYSLIDTMIYFLNTFYGGISEVTLRNNSSIKEDLLKRLAEVRESKQYKETNILNILSLHKSKVREKEFAFCGNLSSENDDNIPF